MYMKKLLLISDCSVKQISGVTRKQNEIIKNINNFDYECKLINTDMLWSFTCRYWSNVKLSIINPISYYIISDIIEKYNPNNICIMTEGMIGLMASIHCNIVGREYSTMRCTRYEDYFRLRNKKLKNYFNFKYAILFEASAIEDDLEIIINKLEKIIEKRKLENFKIIYRPHTWRKIQKRIN